MKMIIPGLIIALSAFNVVWITIGAIQNADKHYFYTYYVIEKGEVLNGSGVVTATNPATANTSLGEHLKKTNDKFLVTSLERVK